MPQYSPLTTDAMTLITTNTPARDSIKKLLQQAPQWMVTDSLFDVCLRLFALAHCDPAFIDGRLMALLAKRLLASEEQPGGPYMTTDGNKIATNLVIAHLFRLLKAPLPNVEAYLALHADYIATPEVQAVSLLLQSRRHTSSPSALAPVSRTAQAVQTELQRLPVAVRRHADVIWNRIRRADTRYEISEFNSLFADAVGATGDPATVATLNRANYYAWMAYTVYDDCIDGGDTLSLLPVAHIAHRASVENFLSVASSPARRAAVMTCFTTMDAANTWEMERCRFRITGDTIHLGLVPRYGRKQLLHQRAAAHILGPQLLLGTLPRSNRASTAMVKNGLQQYLIARQLSDDIHDWKEDLTNGHISYVVAHLLKSTRAAPGNYSMHALIPRLQHYFWEQGFLEMNRTIATHVHLSRKYFEKSGIVTMTSPFIETTLDAIATSVRESQRTVQNQHDFLTVFTNH